MRIGINRAMVRVALIGSTLGCSLGETGGLRASLVDDLIAGYARIETVSCEVRRITTGEGGTQRMNSRVHFQAPNRLHSETVFAGPVGVRRRVLSDGNRLFLHIEGRSRGTVIPLDTLDLRRRMELQRVPGTPMDHLLRLRALPETVLPSTEDYPVRRLYAADNRYVELCLDAEGRPVRIAYYRDADMTDLQASTNYDAFDEVLDGVWIPRRHQGELFSHGAVIRETVRLGALTVNTPLSSAIFDSAVVFPGVEFVAEADDSVD